MEAMERVSILCVVILTQLFPHLLFSEHLMHSRFWAVRKQEGVLLSAENSHSFQELLSAAPYKVLNEVVM